MMVAVKQLINEIFFAQLFEISIEEYFKSFCFVCGRKKNFFHQNDFEYFLSAAMFKNATKVDLIEHFVSSTPMRSNCVLEKFCTALVLLRCR